ncbi:MAG: hypothetical protein NT099_06280 [Candidatus Saganbacteria bacterium]|nr:hypothetical protein [Candidatus Saganbacteria bacterium]
MFDVNISLEMHNFPLGVYSTIADLFRNETVKKPPRSTKNKIVFVYTQDLDATVIKATSHFKAPFYKSNLYGVKAFCAFPRGRGSIYLVSFKDASFAVRMIEHLVKEMFVRFFMDFNIVFLHASAVMVKKGALLFLAPSGGGKSTISGFFPSQNILADDAVGVRFESGNYHVLSPFFPKLELGGWGEEKEKNNKAFGLNPFRKEKLSAIFFIHKSKRNYLQKKDPTHCLLVALWKQMLPVTLLPRTKKFDMENKQRLFRFLKGIIQAVPVFDLHFRKDNSFLPLLDSIGLE